MNISYQILWFENDFVTMEPLVSKIQKFIEDLGFKFVYPQIEADSSNVDKIKYENYDLILMDYKLSDDEKGDALIQKIRNQQFYTDIVFYSSSPIPNLRQAIQDKEIDGVYCVGRAAVDFLPKVQAIINATVKKVLDLNNIRGLVMAEVSDFDSQMQEIIDLYLANCEIITQNSFMETRRKKTIESLESKIKTINATDVLKLHYERDFDSSQKLRTVKEIVKSIEEKSVEICLQSYDAEIIQNRNKLGHVKEIIDVNGKKCLKDGEFVFNDSICKQILSAIKKHAANFSKIKEKLLSYRY